MSTTDHKDNLETSGEISIKDVFNKTRSAIRYFKQKWLTILVITIIGAIAGLAYSILKRPTYTATCTFVLDDSEKTGLFSQYAGLASLAGINLNNNGGLFKGDNILELYKSRSMIEKALLQNVNIGGKNQLLIDRYIDFNKLRSKWKRTDDIDNITFYGDPDKFNRKQDSLITDIVERFNKRLLNVFKPDKKLSIVEVDVASHDELFAQMFTLKLVETVNEFYVKTITQKALQNVLILQRQADSVKRVLNASIGGVASAMDAAPNANPLLLSLKVPSQRKQVDVQAGGAIYSEIMQNLEIAKVSLRQATPLIQVIDKPVLPLTNNIPGKAKCILLGALAGCLLTMAYLFIYKVYQKIAH